MTTVTQVNYIKISFAYWGPGKPGPTFLMMGECMRTSMQFTWLLVLLGIWSCVFCSGKKIKLRRKKSNDLITKTLTKDEKLPNDSNVLPIILSLPEFGDMDVPGKQLLAGTMFCIGKIRPAMGKEQQRFSLIGNNNLTGDEGIANLVKYMKDGRIIIGAIGTENLLRLFAHPELQKALYMFPVDGSSVVRQKNNPAAIFYRQTYKQELKALVDYAIKTKFKTRFGILYEAGLWGNGLYQELLKILEEKGIEPTVVARYQHNTVEVEGALKVIKAAVPGVVFCLAKPRPTYKFVKDAFDNGMHSTIFMGISPIISIQNLIKQARGVDLVCVSAVPPEDSELELVKKYRMFFSDRFDFKQSKPMYLESFLYANLLIDALKNVPGAVKNPELLINYFEQFKNRNFWGLPLSFDPKTRSLATKMWIAPAVDKPWIEIDV